MKQRSSLLASWRRQQCTARAQKQSLHLEEAKEMCPEGHELSESYQPEGLHSTPGGMLPISVCKFTEQMSIAAKLLEHL